MNKEEWVTTKRHVHHIHLSKPYSNDQGETVALLTKESCAKIKCKNLGSKKFMVKGQAHRLAYLKPEQRRKLGKEKYQRKITDKGQMVLAKDKRGHWRRVRAY